jgi:DNA-binding transcriptional regulator LsrR (DeoR family)
MPPDDRLIAVDIAMLRRVRKRLLVVRGADRAPATLAAIRGGLATHLCVDQALAEALLAAS